MESWTDFLTYRKQSLVYFHIFSIFSNLLMLVLPIYTIQIFNRVLFSSSLETLTFLVVIALFLLAIQSISEYGRQQILDNLSFIYDSQYKENAIQTELNTNNIHAEISRSQFERHILVKQYLASPFHRCSADLPWTIIFILVMYLLHPMLGIYSLLAGLMLAVVSTFFVVGITQDVQKLKSSELSQKKSISGLLRKKIFGRSLLFWDRELQRHTLIDQQLLSREASTKQEQNRLMNTVRLLRVYIQVGVFAVGAWLVIDQEIMAGSLLAASILLGRILSPIEQGASHYSSWKVSRSAYLSLVAEFASTSGKRKSVDIPTTKAELVVDGLVYKSKDDIPILKGINLALKPGSCLEIRGDAGSGKSTLMSLLARSLEPTSGKIRLNGVDLEHISLESFRQCIAYAPQEPEIFSASIADNISGFDKGENVAQRVFKASNHAFCHMFISRLADSYTSKLDRPEVKLSWGEKKKLSLARCFYAEPKLLILDEPTVTNDVQSSKSIASHLLALKQSGTSIVMTTSDPELKGIADYAVELKRGAISQVVELKKPVRQVSSYGASVAR